jgi:hypothetical protein
MRWITYKWDCLTYNFATLIDHQISIKGNYIAVLQQYQNISLYEPGTKLFIHIS